MKTDVTQNSIFQEAQTPACQNCGSTVDGQFCAACGQKHPQQRLTIRALLHLLYEQLFEIDRGFFFTIRELFLRPRSVIQGYVSGRRVVYANPIRYILIWLGLSTLLTLTFLDTEKIMEQTTQQFSSGQTSKLPPEKARRLREVQDNVKALQQEMFRNPQFTYALLIPMLSALTALFFRRSGFNYTEHLVFNTYVMAQVIIIFIPLYALYYFFPERTVVVSQVSLLISGLYFAGVGAVVFKRKNYFFTGLKALVAYCLAYLLFGLVFGIIAFVYFFILSGK